MAWFDEYSNEQSRTCFVNNYFSNNCWCFLCHAFIFDTC